MMHVLSLRFPSNCTRHLLGASALLVAFVAGVAVQTVWAHDSRLDDALAAIEKAQVLLQVAQEEGVPTFPEKIAHALDRRLGRALDDLADAYDEVLIAIELEDSVP